MDDSFKAGSLLELIWALRRKRGNQIVARGLDHEWGEDGTLIDLILSLEESLKRSALNADRLTIRSRQVYANSLCHLSTQPVPPLGVVHFSPGNSRQTINLGTAFDLTCYQGDMGRSEFKCRVAAPTRIVPLKQHPLKRLEIDGARHHLTMRIEAAVQGLYPWSDTGIVRLYLGGSALDSVSRGYERVNYFIKSAREQKLVGAPIGSKDFTPLDVRWFGFAEEDCILPAAKNQRIPELQLWEWLNFPQKHLFVDVIVPASICNSSSGIDLVLELPSNAGATFATDDSILVNCAPVICYSEEMSLAPVKELISSLELRWPLSQRVGLVQHSLRNLLPEEPATFAVIPWGGTTNVSAPVLSWVSSYRRRSDFEADRLSLTLFCSRLSEINPSHKLIGTVGLFRTDLNPTWFGPACRTAWKVRELGIDIHWLVGPTASLRPPIASQFTPVGACANGRGAYGTAAGPSQNAEILRRLLYGFGATDFTPFSPFSASGEDLRVRRLVSMLELIQAVYIEELPTRELKMNVELSYPEQSLSPLPFLLKSFFSYPSRIKAEWFPSTCRSTNDQERFRAISITLSH